MRRFPWYGWLGLAVMLISEVCMLAHIEPFYHWHTPIAWSGYIPFVDAIVWKRRGDSWIRNNRSELFFAACVSVPVWVLFELYNKYSIHSWYYLGLPDQRLVRDFGYAWSFATIIPAIFETADLVSGSRDRRAPHDRLHPSRRERLGAGAWAMILLGGLMIVVPMFVHSAWLAAPVWLGFILLLDPINARAGSESILADWRHGRRSRLVNLLVAGLVCGIVWEFWNYWGGTKWIYNVPILPEVRIFEMPILGFGGFPPFGVECFVMYVTVRRLLWRGSPRPIAI
jgi:hypothetical protein